MSSQASFVSISTAQAQDVLTDTHNMQVVGSRYETTPDTVTDGMARAFQIDAQGKMVITGPTADNNAFIGNPVPVGRQYNATLPTYGDGDVAVAQADSRGRTIVTDDQALTQLTAILAAVDGLEGFTDGLEGFTDGLETLIGTTNTSLTTLQGYVDGLEALATTLNGYVDGLEGYNDGLETLIGTTNTTLTTLNGYVDGLEGFTDGIETLLTTLNGYVDGLEGFVDGIETLITSTNTKLDTVIANTGGLAYVGSNVKNSGTITSGAWTQLIASTAAATKQLTIFDSSGYSFEIGTGAAASESRVLVVPPGGLNGPIPLSIAASTRISARAISTTCDYTSAEMILNLLG